MHILTNGPHLVTPQQALEVFQTHILGEISCYFRTVIVKDPVERASPTPSLPLSLPPSPPLSSPPRTP